jgi:hypothetical protein
VDEKVAVEEVTGAEMVSRITKIAHLAGFSPVINTKRDAKGGKANAIRSYEKGKEEIMETSVDDIKLKNLMKQAIIEVIEANKEVVHDFLVVAMEDIALIRAIREGEDSGPATRDEIFEILSGSEGSA